MRRFLTAGMTACIACLLSGCLETTRIYVLNPDGSGKVTVDTLMPDQATAADGNEKPNPAKQKEVAKLMAQDLVSQSEGVDAWSDLVFDVNADGKAHIKGTAYFSDINNL